MENYTQDKGATANRLRLLLWLLLMSAAWTATAQAAEAVFVEELTWTELQDQIHAGKTVIIVPIDTFEKTLEYAARSFKLHGYRDVVFIGDHGGYQSNIKAVVTRLNREWASTAVRVHAIEEYYRAAAVSFPEALKHRGYRNGEIGTHAGLADTSLMLAVDPHAVRAHRLSSDTRLDAAHGVYGDPRRASAELGEIGVNIVVSQTVEAIKKAVARQ